MTLIPRRKKSEKGTALFVGTAALVFVIPMVGLSIDVGMLYATKAKMQAAVDGAALGAARALSIGATTDDQKSSAKHNAVNWFYANFPAGNWATSGTVMTTADANVNVYDDATNPHLRHVDITASTTVPTWFMKWLGFSSTTINSVGNATRRDAAIMMVLDRSGSMGAACSDLRTAAKIFTGQFAENRDYIGMVSFADNVYAPTSGTNFLAPTQTFQATLGYTNISGSGTGTIDNIACAGGTNTAQAISFGYNELYKLDLEGALNVLMFETDGLPNTITVNLWDGSTSGISNSSHCTDKNGVLKTNGGFASASAIPSWTSGHTMNLGGTGYMSDIPAGMVGGFGGYDPNATNMVLMFKSWTTSTSNTFNESSGNYIQGGETSSGGSCLGTNPISSGSPTDIASMPTTDAYGNNMNTGYKTVSGISGSRTTTVTQVNVRAMAFNAADSAATYARSHNANLPVYFFGLGLGGTSTNPPDYVLMQRMANDPNADTFNAGHPVSSSYTGYYQACAVETGCATHSDQTQGTFIYAPNTSNLSNAFLKLSSQILRLSK